MRNVTVFFSSRKYSLKVPSLVIFVAENIKGAVTLLFVIALLLLSSALAVSVLLEYKIIRQAYLKSVMGEYSVKSNEIREHIGFLLRESSVYFHIAGIYHTPKSMEDFGVGGGAVTTGQSVSDRLLIEYNVNENILDNIVFNKSNILAKLKEINHELKIMPSIAPSEGHISSGFGNRVHPILGSIEFHRGVDISARTGTPIVSAAEGVVVRSEYSGEYGNVVEVEHGGGRYRTLYAHMYRRKVSVGDKVNRWEILGVVGATGRTTGPHLHYEVIRDGTLLNPRYFLFPYDVIIN